MLLFKHATAQHFHFLLCEEAPVTTTEVLFGEPGKLHTVELDHVVAEVLEDTTHNTVLAAVDLNAHLAVVVLVGVFNGVGMHLTILQLNAVGNLLQVFNCHVLVEEYVIHLLLQELRMRQLAGQLAVVGEQQYAGGVAVETSHGIDALGAGVLHNVHHGLALLGIVACGHAVLRLVEQDVYLLLNGHRLVVELHLIGALHLCAQFGHHLSVDGHLTLLDVLISLTTRAYTGIGEILVQTDGLVRIDVLFLIFDTLLEAVLCVWIIALTVVAALALLMVATLLRTTVATLPLRTFVATLSLWAWTIAALSLWTIATLSLRTIATLSLRTVATLSLRTVATLTLRTIATLTLRAVATLSLRTVATLSLRTVTALSLLWVIAVAVLVVIVTGTLLITVAILIVVAGTLLVAALLIGAGSVVLRAA